MEGLKRCLALAAFEARLNRRMVRAWVLGILALLIPVAQSGQLFAVHRYFSGFNGSWSIVTRDLWILQPTLTLGAILGLFGVFYAFDWRSRDVTSHFAATLDASPLTRLQHAWGKFLGLVPILLAPMILLFVAQLVTSLVSGVRVPWQVFVVCYGLFAIPAALTSTALTFGLAGLLRGQGIAWRLLAAACGIAWLAAGFGVGFGLSERWAVLMGALVDMPVWSDWVGYEWSPISIVQRCWSVGVIGFFVSLAALGPLGLPQDLAERRRRVLTLGALGAVAVGASALAGWLYLRGSTDAEAVVAAEARAAAQPRLTVARRDIELDLTRRGRLAGTATLELKNQTSETVTAAILRLNRGFAISEARVDGAPAQASQDETVVSVPVSLAPGAGATLVLRYEGTLDEACIDAAATSRTRDAGAVERNNRRILGTAPAYLRRGVAVLPADSGFYPDTAMLQGVEHPRRAYPDLAPCRLRVKLPDGWTAAATGRREGAAPDLTFTADTPVAGLALCAGPYREAQVDAGGVTFRLLWHPRHGRNVEFFAPAKDAITAALAERIADIKARTGLESPVSEISVVDVPQLLTTFGGTWDSPNRLGQPGLVLAKEGSVFGAWFAYPLKQAEESAKTAGATAPAAASGAEPAAASDAGASGASAPAPVTAASASEAGLDPGTMRLDILRRFVATDFTGGAVERLAMRTFWDARVRPDGEGLGILGPALSSFVSETALGRFTVDTSESARVINDGQVIGQVIQALTQKRDAEIPDIVMRAIVDPDDAYAYMRDVPLDEMDPRAKPREWAGALYIKGRRPLMALRDATGSSGFASALATAAAGPTLTWPAFREAVVAAAPPADAPQVAVLLDNWLTGTRLPGFVVEDCRTLRLPGDAESWQVVATIANKGEADGLARLSVGEGRDAIGRLLAVPAGGRVEAGLVTPRKIDRWKLEPYLALNRTVMTGAIVPADADPAAVPFDGIRPAPAAAGPHRIVVDNLDEGFTVVVDGQPRAFGAVDDEGKRILAKWNGWNRPRQWSRWNFDGRWGRPFGTFDETAAVRRGTEDGKEPAAWTTALDPGSWRVETWLPPAKNPTGAGPAKSFEFVVVSTTGETPVSLTLDAGKEGWNDLGVFRFDGKAEVRLLDKGDGLVVADAVRFTKESE